jgi:hypothetical protein
MRRQLLPGVLLFVGVALFAGGCGGGGAVQVNGVLTWEDGTPIPQATVVFHPQNPKEEATKSASGFTDNNGAFTLTTDKPGDGVYRGSYIVIATKTESAGGGGPGENPNPTAEMAKIFAKKAGFTPKNILPPVYATTSSPLREKITSSGQRVEVKLQKAAPKVEQKGKK